MEPKVSVIVPVYNTEAYLEKCLQSLLGQTLEELEIIAIDDGSTDGSLGILRKYETRFPERLRVLTQENSGQAVARNRGLWVSRGEYIGFLDSDDFARREMFQKLYEAAREADADYVACGYMDTAMKNGRRVVRERYVASRTARTQRDMFLGALVPPYLHLYRASVLRKAKAAFTEGVIYEDTSFYMKLIPYLHTLAEVPEALVVRLRREGSTMATISLDRVRQIFPVLADVVDFYRENGFWEEFHEGVEYMCVRILACSSLRRAAGLRSSRERAAFVGETMDFLAKYVPNFKKNLLIRKGVKHLYLRTFCKCTAYLYMLPYRFRSGNP